MRQITDNRGIALPMAIFALVVVGVLVTASFFIGRQEQLVGRNTIRIQQAFAAADAGAQLRTANWNPNTMNALAIGDSTSFGGTLTGSGWYRGTVRRLNSLLFLVRSEGFSRDSTARQHIGLLVRLRPIEVPITAALKTQGATKIGGSSFIDGNDNLPAGWTDCPALKPPLPGIQLPDSGLITTTGCAGLSCVAGSPKVSSDPSINTATLTTFGDADFDDLHAMATKIVPGGVRQIQPTFSASGCNFADLNNWGSPLQPNGTCGSYFPIVWSEGNLTINGVQGQGVLVVNGDLAVQGGFEFYGPVIVRGRLKTEGTGGHFNGGVVAANVDLEQNDVLGNAVVSFSSCAVARALRNSAPASLLRERSWVNLY